ncbi:sensor histidine kinase [Streptomyces diastatochromogenes]|uniref:Histidine kinase domain-containing protein n=1 Tax=Streptomyces diastatochromogenes TaxID=42236 RepID=A0A233SH07_STRDA|nr:ATP-binding protein [Streptomyces diastatochromogenes]OXY94928.1 hypothetical protein BEK98_17575 [Streptomyces diastatochromogenes]
MAGERQLTAAAVCAAVTVMLSGLWVCYLLARLGAPGVAASARELPALLYGLPPVVAGVLLHAHRPGIPAGWVLLGYGMAKIVPRVAIAPVWVEQPGPTATALTLVLQTLANIAGGTLWYTLPLWFPDGHLPSRWWRLYVAAVALWMVPQAFSFTADEEIGGPNPLAVGWWGETAAYVDRHLGTVLELSHYVLTCVAVLVAWSRAGESSRRRHIHLLLTAYLIWAAAQAIYKHVDSRYFWTTFWLFAGASALLSTSVFYVVVRTGTWRISRSARRVLAGLMVTMVLVALYVTAAAVLATGMVLGRAADALVLMAVAFLLGAGLRRTTAWATELVDRLFYGERAHPYQVLNTLAERVSRAVSPEEIPGALCTTVVENLRLPGAVLVLHTRAGPRVLADVGRLGTAQQHFELRHHGAVIGRMSVGPREGEQALDAQDTSILASLAQHAAPALASLRLQQELRAGREQIVLAREEERRHLRRDIHDGLGPTLAGLRLRVENATARLPSGDPVRDALRAAADELGMAIQEVRRITERLGPAPLGELGLSLALGQLVSAFDGARTRIELHLTPSPLPPLPAAVEVAAYRIAAEALTNVMRHAEADHSQVRVRVDAHTLTLTVIDDGIGYDPDPKADGIGLRSMAERAAEIGGSFTIDRRGRGTRVRAALPFGQGVLRQVPHVPPSPGAAGRADTEA